MLKRRKPQRVTLRVKTRSRRRKGLGLLVVAVFGSAAAWAAWKAAAPRARAWAAPALTIEAVDASAVPDAARPEVLAVLAALKGRPVSPFEPARLTSSLRARFPYLDGLQLKRSWTARSLTASASLKKAAARVGSSERWLSTEGELFPAPPGLYPEGLARLQLGAAAPEPAELKALAGFLGGLPQGREVREAGYENGGGWSFKLADGLALRWGGLGRAADKWRKLDEVLADARGRYPGVLSANLRYFDDGRILIEPQPKAPEPAKRRPAAKAVRRADAGNPASKDQG